MTVWNPRSLNTSEKLSVQRNLSEQCYTFTLKNYTILCRDWILCPIALLNKLTR